MYGSLKKQNRIRLPNGKTLLVVPKVSGRDSGAVSDPKELQAIESAVSRHQPLYFLQHANGSVYDVLVDKTHARSVRDTIIAKTPDGKLNVKLYEQRAGSLFLVP